MEENINHLLTLFNNSNYHQLFEDHQVEIQSIVNRYLHLRELSVNAAGDYTQDAVFRRYYCYFYGMRYVPAAYKDLYFGTMRACVDNPNHIDLEQLLVSLRNDVSFHPRIEMSFVSKLMNFVNEEDFPIYDKGIREAFGFVIPGDEETKLAYYPQMYQAIIDAYTQLADHPAIDVFREAFNCRHFSSFRIIDFIVISIIRHQQ